MTISGIDTTFLVELEVQECRRHRASVAWMQSRLQIQQQPFALSPQVLTEFIHVVTDPRRFERPLEMRSAIARATFWWQAREVHRVFPSSESTSLFLRWMSQFDLGRKRILDTFLAATYQAAGVAEIVTTNARDFSVLDGITVVQPK